MPGRALSIPRDITAGNAPSVAAFWPRRISCPCPYRFKPWALAALLAFAPTSLYACALRSLFSLAPASYSTAVVLPASIVLHILPRSRCRSTPLFLFLRALYLVGVRHNWFSRFPVPASCCAEVAPPVPLALSRLVASKCSAASLLGALTTSTATMLVARGSVTRVPAGVDARDPGAPATFPSQPSWDTPSPASSCPTPSSRRALF